MPPKREKGKGRLKALGDRLQALREPTGLSQADVAARLGVPKSTYIGWESGRREPGALTLADLSRILGVDLGAIMDGVPAIPELPGPTPKKPGRKPKIAPPAEPTAAKPARSRKKKGG